MSNVPFFPPSSKAEAEELRPCNKPLSALTKAEASEWLQALGEEPGVRWTSVEIKSRIKDIINLMTEEESQLPKNMTGMKKADLQRECTERTSTSQSTRTEAA